MSISFFAPEVIQTSALDCGPAALKSLLGAFDIHVDYGHLREACHTDVDGTSIDTMEEIACDLGLEAEQQMLPPENLLDPAAENLPSIVITLDPTGIPHFLVAWRHHGPLIQVMNPLTGRRWMTPEALRRELYIHTAVVPATVYRDWACSDSNQAALRRRLGRLGGGHAAQALINIASSAPDWLPMAALDAALRMVEALVKSKGVKKGRAAVRLVEQLLQRAQAGAGDHLPQRFWTALPAQDDEDGEPQVAFTGAVFLQGLGKKPEAGAAERRRGLSEGLRAALDAKPVDSLQVLWRVGLAEARGMWPLLVMTTLGVGVGVGLQAVLFRGLMEVWGDLAPPLQKVGILGALTAFLVVVLVLETLLHKATRRLGRRVETHLRLKLMRRLPQVDERYFGSRTVSDMAQRAHGLNLLREMPVMMGNLARVGVELTVTTLGLIWLYPRGAPWAMLAAALAVIVPIAWQPALLERELRKRSHAAALALFYLEALLGLTAIRTHRAESSFSIEHDGRLSDWITAGRDLHRALVSAEGLQLLLSFAIIMGLFASYASGPALGGGALLYLYWTLQIPALGAEVAVLLRQLPEQRNIALRLLELIEAGSSADSDDAAPPPAPEPAAQPRGATLALEGVRVLAAGHPILTDVNLSIPAGQHLAVVGASGSGKSSLIATLLGLHKPIHGHVRVDGAPLNTASVEALRRTTVWLDPAARIWTTNLLNNVIYGDRGAHERELMEVVTASDLISVLERLPDGWQTDLGEGGGVLSGGEGQRVRLARALRRANPRLVLLDEPFRGLDRTQRRRLLGRARQLWRDTTLLCVTHDVWDTQDFDHVVVMGEGTVIETGSPGSLSAEPHSAYAQLLNAETRLREGPWADPRWRRLWMDEGHLTEGGGP